MNNKTILIVEDEKDLSQVVEYKLQASGFSVLSVRSAEEALEFLKNQKPDLIWLDILLPGMSGLKFLEFIRNNDNYKDIPVVIASVLNDKKIISKAAELNIIDFVVKSEYKLEDISNKIKSYLNLG